MNRWIALVMLVAIGSGVPLAAESVPDSGPRALSRAFREAASRATPSVVTVVAYGQSQRTDDDDPELADRDPIRPQPGRPEREDRDHGGRLPATGLGSGVILNAEGVIVTNHHVIAEARRIVVRLDDGTELEASDAVSDPDSDLATIRVPPDPALVAAELGDSEALEIGDWVLAIGSPFQLASTVSVGIISAKDRRINRISRGRLLQTDAAINPGNSGGPLVDLDGRVIGISTAIATRNGGYQGIGFAIPIAQARWITQELLDHGHVRRAAMGIRLAELEPRVASRLEVQPRTGVLVYQVVSDSPAARAGLQAMDIIVEFAGERVRRSADLQEVVERKAIGSTQPVKIIRQGEEMTVEVTLEPLRPSPPATSTPGAEPAEDDGEGSEEGDEANDR